MEASGDLSSRRPRWTGKARSAPSETPFGFMGSCARSLTVICACGWVKWLCCEGAGGLEGRMNIQELPGTPRWLYTRPTRPSQQPVSGIVVLTSTVESEGPPDLAPPGRDVPLPSCGRADFLHTLQEICPHPPKSTLGSQSTFDGVDFQWCTPVACSGTSFKS